MLLFIKSKFKGPVIKLSSIPEETVKLQSASVSCDLYSLCLNSKRINSPMTLSALTGGLGDEASPTPTPSAPPHSGPLTHSASWECLSTLPTNGSPLRHVTHVRPRPPRRHRAAYYPPESVSSGSHLSFSHWTFFAFKSVV